MRVLDARQPAGDVNERDAPPGGGVQQTVIVIVDGHQDRVRKRVDVGEWIIVRDIDPHPTREAMEPCRRFRLEEMPASDDHIHIRMPAGDQIADEHPHCAGNGFLTSNGERLMEAVLIDPTKKGTDKFYIGTVPTPQPAEGEVLVEVKAVALSAWEKQFVQDDDTRSLTRKTRKKAVNLGLEFSGVVRSDGQRFKRGQRVIGGTHLMKDEKALAQYVSAREAYLAELPDSLSLTQAAALPIGAETALTSLDKAALRSGDNVLVVGASGGVGVYAVQIAAARGAAVTAIGGPDSLARLKQIGATTSHYYGDTSFEDLTDTFDVVFDLSGRLRFGQVKKKLSRKGTFINANPQHDIMGMIASLFSGKKMPFIFVPRSSATMQTRILDMVTRGEIKPIVEADYNINQFHTAFTALAGNERFGKIVISY